MTGFIIIILLLAACGGGDETVDTGPSRTPLPTLTPTVRSTPLPDVPTVEPLGSRNRPIQVAFVASDPETSALTSLERQLNRALDVEIEVVSFATMGEALIAICDGSTPTMAWVDAFTYIAADQACSAIPHLGVELSALETRRNNFEIIYNGTLNPVPADFADLTDKIWCRIDATDKISWVYPTLAMQAEEFNPVIGLGGVVDVEDYSALVLAVHSGTCDMGAIPQGTLRTTVRQLERANRQDEDAEEELIIDLAGETPDLAIFLADEEPWEDIPNEIFVAPDQRVLSTSIQDSIVEAVFEIATDDDDNPITELLTYQEVVEKDARDLRSFRQWLTSANWVMGQ